MAPNQTDRLTPPLGFSLVEIMVAVVIIGLLAAMGIPAMKKSRESSYASQLANDFRVFSGSFETHALENGSWPTDGNGNNLPPSVRPYFRSGDSWYREPITGGWWDWEFERLGYTASIALVPENDFPEILLKVDRILDDGNFATGQFVRRGNRYLYVLEN